MNSDFEGVSVELPLSNYGYRPLKQPVRKRYAEVYDESYSERKKRFGIPF